MTCRGTGRPGQRFPASLRERVLAYAAGSQTAGNCRHVRPPPPGAAPDARQRAELRLVLYDGPIRDELAFR